MFLHEHRGTQLLLPADWWSSGEGGDRALGKGGSETDRETSGQLSADLRLELDH